MVQLMPLVVAAVLIFASAVERHKGEEHQRTVVHVLTILTRRPTMRVRVPLLVFILLVAVGADYSSLLISRLREESSRSTRVGVLRTVASTGSALTSAGVIFAVSMFGLISIATLVREKSWWPQR
ncbi:MMPL family transporter [Mycolicibacterium austroafricanum]|uniref:MMPL family transporter n=1 Tax=Mycolicibacterium austroafricanum TaxID=39687 RepID=UPI002E284F48|nr:MMPL family transporter [Mycolicibacterium austroafricanum]